MTVIVKNLNTYPYKEKFMDRDIFIPPQGEIEMDEGEAQLFLGTFSSPQIDSGGQHLPQGFKMLKIIQTAGEVAAKAEVDALVCQACRFSASNSKLLQNHIFESHKDIALVDEAAETAIAKSRLAASKPGKGRKAG